MPCALFDEVAVRVTSNAVDNQDTPNEAGRRWGFRSFLSISLCVLLFGAFRPLGDDV